MLSQFVEKIAGLRYIIDELDIISAPARRVLYAMPFMTRQEEIEEVQKDTAQIHALVGNKAHAKAMTDIKLKLMQVKDIQGTIRYIESKNVKDDIEFFELKHFALLSEAIRRHAESIGIDCVQIPELSGLIRVLDPEDKKIPSFHIYDAYSQDLAALRKQYKHYKAQGDDTQAETFRMQALEIEDTIRKELSDKIRPFAEALSVALHHVAKLDILIAKSYQISRFNLCCPSVSSQQTSLKAMFNPEIDESLRAVHKHFQPVDIDVDNGVTLIVGANMAGKSVLLKTVALTQYLAQFGFYVPCESAQIVPVEAVFISMGDGQNALQGLSSFGAEMLQLNEIVQQIEQGKSLLVLLDELARTTNPTEGKAIVSGMTEFLQEHQVKSLVTTHYSGLDVKCKRLRVKGFREDKVVGALNTKNINDYMDYALVEDQNNEVPKEAIRIAEILGVSQELLTRTKRYL